MEESHSTRATVSLVAIFLSALFSVGTVSLAEAESMGAKTNISKKFGGAVKKGGEYTGKKSIRGRKTVDRTMRLKRPIFKQRLKNKKTSPRLNSKYIGETEKNLGQLSNAGKDRGNILFFDEADALFGKRSSVKAKAGKDH